MGIYVNYYQLSYISAEWYRTFPNLFKHFIYSIKVLVKSTSSVVVKLKKNTVKLNRSKERIHQFIM